jgi:fructose-bisphosphate aldolase class II
MLQRAREGGYAVGSFNVIDSNTLLGALDAAEEKHSPVILAITNGHLDYFDLEMLTSAAIEAGSRADVSVCVHFDHGTSIAMITRALRAGFGSVMYDGYGAPWEQRLAETRVVVEMAHALGATVEGALSKQSREMTGNPTGDWELPSREMVEEFVEATGIDIVAIGEGSSSFEQEQVAEVAGYKDAYASLHGGSQLPDEMMGMMVSSGLAKCSVYNKAARSSFAAASAYINGGDGDLLSLGREVRRGFAAAVNREIDRLGSADHA